MQSNMAVCMEYVLAHEGSQYTNHPNDPGGPTRWGITLAVARRYWKSNATAQDIRTLSKEVAISIFERQYWDAQNCDALAKGLDYSVFDYGVNSGPGRSARVLQRLVGVKDDGKIGPITLAAIERRSRSSLIEAINDERLRFLKSLRTWRVFGKGWERRVNDVLRLSLDMANKGFALHHPAIALRPVEGRGIVAPQEFDDLTWEREQCFASPDVSIVPEITVSGGFQASQEES